MSQVIKYSRTICSHQKQSTNSPAINTIDYVNNDYVVNPVAVNDKDGRLATRSKIDNYEDSLKDLVGSDRGDMDQINDDGLKEYIAGGAYIRQLFIPRDTSIVSKIWNKERMWIIASGEVTFTTEMGTKRVKAPYTEVVPHGSKVALYTHEDTLWFAITGAESTNLNEIEEEVIAKDYSDCSYPWDQIGETK